MRPSSSAIALTINSINNPILPYKKSSSSRKANMSNDSTNNERDSAPTYNNLFINIPPMDEGKIFYQPPKPTRDFEYKILDAFGWSIKLVNTGRAQR